MSNNVGNEYSGGGSSGGRTAAASRGNDMPFARWDGGAAPF